MLTGQAKTDYQREYMRKRRSNMKGLTETTLAHEPLDPKPVTVVAVLDPDPPEINLKNPAMTAGERNQRVRDRMTALTIVQVEKEYGYVPAWRREQG